MVDEQQVQVPSGHVCVTTYGQVTQQTAGCLLEARSLNEKNGLNNLEYGFMPGTLVDKARNEAVRHMLKRNHGFLVFVDGDTVFAPDAIFRLVRTAFAEIPTADIVGGYVPLRGDLALPTIDTGTGTWESWYPGSGVVEVMRTGGAFVLVKRHVFEALSDPWYRMRVPARPIDFMAEVDNYARIKFDGKNPFRELPEWEKLEKCARDDPTVAAENFTPVEVGEDSGFLDRAKMAGFRAYVNTDIACGHVDHKVIDWTQHRDAMHKMETTNRQLCGLLR